MRVVLIEDNQDSREMLQTLLRLDGHQVESAEDGQKGLDTILQQRPDVAVIDIGLPIMDGYEVARRVRKRFSKSEVLLVALTGYGQEQDREAAYQAGFDEHLVKPVNLEKLKLLLQQPRKPPDAFTLVIDWIDLRGPPIAATSAMDQEKPRPTCLLTRIPHEPAIGFQASVRAS